MTKEQILDMMKKDNENTKRLIDMICNILEEKVKQIEKQEECIFCKSLLQGKSINLIERSCYDVDNTYDFLDNHTKEFNEEHSEFNIVSYDIKELQQRYMQFIFDNQYRVVLDNNEDDLYIRMKRFSYSIPWNYCPMCGATITPNGKPYEEDSFSTYISEEE